MLEFLDRFFIAFHSVLIIFNLTGWIWRSTWKVHLVVISLTLFSWFGLGIFYGWGYCPCTDWHWQVKAKLGEKDLPSSYIKYYADSMTGRDWDAAVIDAIVVSSSLMAFLLSLWKNREWLKQKFK